MDEKYTCIVVDDDPIFIRLFQEYLKKIDSIEVLTAYGDTTKAALNIERLKPDIVFLDINISGLEGPEFMELVDHRPQIVVVSGHPPEIMNRYDIEITAFIQKPFTLEQLKEAVDKCIAELKK